MSTTAQPVRIAEGMWGVDGFAALAVGISLPVRATIVRRHDGTLLIHSPISFSDETAEEIRKLGEVSVLFAPNLYHHLFLKRASALFPQAAVVAPVGMEKKRTDLRVTELVHTAPSEILSADFSQVFVEGAPKFNEVVLFHRGTKTLIVGDYFFNIQEARGFLAPILLPLTGAYKRPAQSRLWRKVTQDTRAMSQCARRILKLDYERVVMCHGDVVDDGRAFSRQTLGWLDLETD